MMKNKLLLTILPLALLASCANSALLNEGELAFEPYMVYENSLPTVYATKDAEHVTYLMLSPFGSIDVAGAPVKGEVSSLFYENTVVWKAEPGTALPIPTSSVAGATFRGWAFYNEKNDNVWPDYYTNVPETPNLALKAIFDGTNAGAGGQSGGGSTPVGPVEDITYTLTGFENWTPNDNCKVFAWGWSATSIGSWFAVTLHYEGSDNDFSNVTGTFTAPNNLIGFNLARCQASTTTPDWNVHDDSDGRVYNKTADITCSVGTTTYTAPAWVPYQ